MNALSQDARALIDSVARLDDPSISDKTRIRQRLGVQLGAAAFATLALTGSAAGAGELAELAATSAGKASVLSGVGKLLLLGGVVGAALAGTWSLGREAPGTVKPALPAAVSSAQPVSLAPAGEPATQALPSSVTASLRSRAEPGASTEQAPLAQLAASGADPAQAARVGKHTPRAPAAKAGAAASPAGRASTLGAELALLRKAQAALRAGQSEQALQLAEAHRARFPEGILKEERSGVEALARCSLGRADPLEAQAFLKLAPSSPLAARVRKACGLE